jgi:hypothetical protein
MSSVTASAWATLLHLILLIEMVRSESCPFKGNNENIFRRNEDWAETYETHKELTCTDYESKRIYLILF